MDPRPEDALFEILRGGKIVFAVTCVARLGIPDLLEGSPRSAHDLADQIGANASALYRLLRMTASIGVLSESADGKFAQTPMSALLRRDSPSSLRSWAILVSEGWMTRGWENLEHSVRTGGSVAEKISLQYNAETLAVLSAAMTALSTLDGPAIVDAYSFAGMRSVCDVGGGHGLLLATILERHPEIRGTLYDQPEVIKGARNGPLRGLLERCELVSGDMFVSIPKGMDAYILKHVIHDWSDDLCVKALSVCRQAVNPGGKLLVADFEVLPGLGGIGSKITDLEMLLFTSGRERTKKEFAELFEKSGWKLNRVITTSSELSSIFEGAPA